MQFGRETSFVALAARAAKQRRRIAQRAEEIAEVAGRTQASRHRPLQGVCAQSPQVEADVADVVPAFVLPDLPHIDGVRDFVEGAVEAVHAFDGSYVGCAQGLRTQMVAHPLCPAQQLEIFDGMRRPSGDVARQLLEHG